MSLKRERTPETATHEVDFDRLADRDAAFAKLYREPSGKRRRLDFQDPQVLRQLSKSLFAVDYGLKVELPADRLCPPIPVRWNYIAWIQQLLDSTTSTYDDTFDPKRPVIGIDIGVGASCVYPLLACVTRSQWQMLGTDIDADSLDHAQRNVSANDFNDRIQLALTTPDDPIIPLVRFSKDRADFSMTNPPFYSSIEELKASYESKELPPSAICTGNDNEMICPGGDSGFVSRIVEESLLLRTRVQWYTAMMGKLSSLHAIVAQLKAHEVNNFAVTSLQAGSRTKRWAVGWSFDDLRPRNDVARHDDVAPSLLPAATATTIPAPLMSAQWSGGLVDQTNRALDVKWTWSPDTSSGVVEATENVWSRAARRKRKFESQHTNTGKDVETENQDPKVPMVAKVLLAVRITCENEKVVVRWLRGQDQVLYQSYCGMLKRSLTNRGHNNIYNSQAQAP